MHTNMCTYRCIAELNSHNRQGAYTHVQDKSAFTYIRKMIQQLTPPVGNDTTTLLVQTLGITQTTQNWF